MSKLDTSLANDYADDLVGVLSDDFGLSPEEALPVLVQAIIKIADGDEQLLDESANLLADGGVQDDDYYPED